MPQPKTLLPNGTTSVEQLTALFEERYAPVPFEVPDYGTRVELQMLSAGEEEHCGAFAREDDGSRNADRYVRIFVAYSLVTPKLATDKNRRIEAEKIATILERAPSDWLAPIFRKAADITYEYQRRRIEREREEEKGSAVPFFLKPGFALTSSPTDSESSPA